MMTLTPVEPRRAMRWPSLVGTLARHAPAPERLFLVGGAVRDALRGAPVQDIDLITADDGLAVARALADTLGGAYYPVDPERRTGRVLLGTEEPERVIIDVASLRGDDLLEDLLGRDFTVNAMAVPLEQPHLVLDPLGGLRDLFDRRVLRQCSPASIRHDPIRALRAARLSLQLNLSIEPETRLSVRAAGRTLVDEAGRLRQPERVRDELIKMLASGQPAASLRLLDALGLLARLLPFPIPPSEVLERRLATVALMHQLFTIIGPARTDNTAADLIFGVAVMVLDRYRRQLQEHLGRIFADGRPLTAVALLGAFTPPDADQPGNTWGVRLRLSNAEARFLNTLAETRQRLPLPRPVSDRLIHRYYRDTEETGITGVLLMLAEHLSAQPPGSVDPEAWGALLEEVAAPLLDAFFRRHQQAVSPPPLIDGQDLMQHLGLKPGPLIGTILDRLLEEQAAGTIRTKQEALQLAERLSRNALS